MLKIRPEQLEQFNQQHVDNMIGMVFRHVAERHPERIAGLTEADARRDITLMIDRARRYGIATIAGIGAFVSLCVVVSPQFDEHPKVRAILDGAGFGLESATPDARVEALGSLLSDIDWADAQALGSTAPTHGRPRYV
jgi:hypothetical protein